VSTLRGLPAVERELSSISSRNKVKRSVSKDRIAWAGEASNYLRNFEILQRKIGLSEPDLPTWVQSLPMSQDETPAVSFKDVRTGQSKRRDRVASLLKECCRKLSSRGTSKNSNEGMYSLLHLWLEFGKITPRIAAGHCRRIVFP
jgi:hypothetical protein